MADRQVKEAEQSNGVNKPGVEGKQNTSRQRKPEIGAYGSFFAALLGLWNADSHFNTSRIVVEFGEGYFIIKACKPFRGS